MVSECNEVTNDGAFFANWLYYNHKNDKFISLRLNVL